MKTFELAILANTLKRCYGLAHCIVNDVRGWQQETANQTGFRLQFVQANAEEIKRFAAVRTEVLNPSH